MRHKDFVTIKDWAAEELEELLASARAIKADPMKYRQRLDGKALAMILEKPSLRTRVSFDAGIHQLGGFSIFLTSAEINLGKRESIRDVAKNLERMVQGIMIRTFDHARVEEMAAEACIPVINGLTDFSHPCQAMADFLTMLETKGDVRRIKIAYIGDGNNVAHSLIFAAARLGAHLVVATPEGYAPDAEAVRWAKEHGQSTGSRIEIVQDPVAAAQDADVIYTDVWTSMGMEAENAQRQKDFRLYQINEDLVRHARPDYVFMHCLPAHRGEEVSDSVIDSVHSIVFQQAENRLHAQKAVLLALMG